MVQRVFCQCRQPRPLALVSSPGRHVTVRGTPAIRRGRLLTLGPPGPRGPWRSAPTARASPRRGAADKTVRLWDAATGRGSPTLEGHSSYASRGRVQPRRHAVGVRVGRLHRPGVEHGAARAVPRAVNTSALSLPESGGTRPAADTFILFPRTGRTDMNHTPGTSPASGITSRPGLALPCARPDPPTDANGDPLPRGTVLRLGETGASVLRPHSLPGVRPARRQAARVVGSFMYNHDRLSIWDTANGRELARCWWKRTASPASAGCVMAAGLPSSKRGASSTNPTPSACGSSPTPSHRRPFRRRTRGRAGSVRSRAITRSPNSLRSLSLTRRQDAGRVPHRRRHPATVELFELAACQSHRDLKPIRSLAAAGHGESSAVHPRREDAARLRFRFRCQCEDNRYRVGPGHWKGQRPRDHPDAAVAGAA